jgi:hypothetical protein
VKWFDSTALSLLLGLSLAGCETQNASSGEDAVVDAGVDDALGDAAGGAAHGLTPEQLSGDYFFVVSTKLLPKAPAVFLAQVQAESEGDRILMRLRQQPLSKSDRATPVALWGPWDSGTVDRDGHFVSRTIEARIPAEANPITGFDTDARIMLDGQMSDAFDLATLTGPVDFMCGHITGSILRPIVVDDLSGSTYTATRIADIDDPSTYPKDVVINCQGDLARPL